MPEFKCDTCKSTDFEVKRRGPHYGLYCKKCGAWQKMAF